MSNNASSDSSGSYRAGFRGGYASRGRGGGSRKIFNVRIDKLEKRWERERERERERVSHVMSC